MEKPITEAEIVTDNTQAVAVRPSQAVATRQVGANGGRLGDCILWTKGKTSAGYGNIYLGGGRKSPKWVLAHRQAYQNRFGPIPAGMLVLHRCDTPACVNPDHLFLGTFKDNTQDAWKKGRLKPIPAMKGERNPKSKLSPDEVIEIRRLYASGTMFQKQLSKRFGVLQVTISRIVRRQIWKHL